MSGALFSVALSGHSNAILTAREASLICLFCIHPKYDAHEGAAEFPFERLQDSSYPFFSWLDRWARVNGAHSNLPKMAAPEVTDEFTQSLGTLFIS